MAKQIRPAINDRRNKSQQIATIILTVPGSIVAANLESGRGTMMLKSISNMPTIWSWRFFGGVASGPFENIFIKRECGLTKKAEPRGNGDVANPNAQAQN
jgi:hypothetical protein